MYDLYGALIGNLSNYLYTYILIILLVAGGIYFTVRTKFVQFRYLKESLRVVLAPIEYFLMPSVPRSGGCFGKRMLQTVP